MATVQLVLESNTRAHLVGDFPDAKLDHAFSVVTNKQFFRSAAYKHGYDGRKHYYVRKTKSFPAGLWRDIRKWLKAAGHTVSVTDHRAHALTPGPVPTTLGGDITLRDYQVEAVAKALKQGRGILHVATGGGKTELMAALIEAYGRPVTVVLTSKATLVQQTRERLAWRLGLDPYDLGVITQGRWLEGEVPIYVALVTTWGQTKHQARRQELSKSCRLLLIDECFPAGTQVGDRPIEALKFGDVVPAWDAQAGTVVPGKVCHVFKSRPQALVRLSIATKTVICTPNHPFMTRRGWVPAQALTCTDMVLYAGEHDSAALRRLPHALKASCPQWARLDRIEVLESGSDGKFAGLCPDGFVYNIEVEKHHTYLANGFVVHNCHHLGSASWYKTAQNIHAYHRFGLTGTPTGRSDGKDIALRAVTGKVVAKVSAHSLVERGILAKPHVYFTDVHGPKLQFMQTYSEVYTQGIVQNDKRNDIIVRYAQELAAAGRKTWVFVRQIAHGKELERRIAHSTFLAAQTASVFKQRAVVDRFVRGKVDTLILTNIFDEGVDTPAVDAIIMAAGGKSSIETLQRVGRGMRAKDDNRLFVFDFYDQGHEYLSRHAEARKRTCEAVRYATECWEAPRPLAAVCA